MTSSAPTPLPALPRRVAAKAVRRIRRGAAATAPTAPPAPPTPRAPSDTALARRVAVLEREVQELRRLSRRLSDVLEIVTELLVPAVDRDDERLAAALGRLEEPDTGGDTEPDSP